MRSLKGLLVGRHRNREAHDSNFELFLAQFFFALSLRAKLSAATEKFTSILTIDFFLCHQIKDFGYQRLRKNQ